MKEQQRKKWGKDMDIPRKSFSDSQSHKCLENKESEDRNTVRLTVFT